MPFSLFKRVALYFSSNSSEQKMNFSFSILIQIINSETIPNKLNDSIPAKIPEVTSQKIYAITRNRPHIDTAIRQDY